MEKINDIEEQRQNIISSHSELSEENLERLTDVVQAGLKSRGKRPTTEKANPDSEIERASGVLTKYSKFAMQVDGIAQGITGAMGELFASFIPPQGALTPLEQFMKQVVLTVINAVQGIILAAAAAIPAKGITSFGISMITDAPLLAAAYAALEIAKGFVGGFAKGTDSLHKSGYAFVGEQGPELVYLNQGTKIFNNNDTNKMLNNARANQPSSQNVNNVYIASSLDALSFFRVNYPKYKKFKSLQAV